MLPAKLFYSQEMDQDLFLMVKQNDVGAFEELYNRYWRDLVNIACKKLNSKEKAEDIVQNIFTDIYQRREKIELTISLKNYLSQAVKFKVLNEFRSAIITHKYQDFIFFCLERQTDFANPVEAKDLEMEIYKVLNGLPEKCRQVFLLSRKENLSNRDISVTLNITVSTVEKHITKALKALKSSQISDSH